MSTKQVCKNNCTNVLFKVKYDALANPHSLSTQTAQLLAVLASVMCMVLCVVSFWR